VGVERGLKINPNELSCLAFLSREDVCDEMVPVEEPSSTEDIEDIKKRKFHSAVLPITGLRRRRGHGRLAKSRGGRGSHLCPLRGWGRGKGRATSRCKHGDDGGKRSRRPGQTWCHMRVQLMVSKHFEALL
jgi:hypothetical protein